MQIVLRGEIECMREEIKNVKGENEGLRREVLGTRS